MRIFSRIRIIFYCTFLQSISLSLLVGCTHETSTVSTTSQNQLSFDIKSTSTSANETGIVSSIIEIPAGTTAFQVALFGDFDLQYKFISLIAPSGQLLMNTDDLLAATGEEEASGPPIVFNYPSNIATSRHLQEGNYNINFQVQAKNGKPKANSPVVVSYLSRGGSGDYSRSAVVNVNVILAGAVADDIRNNSSIMSALAKVQTIYEQQSIELALNIIKRADLPTVLPNPNDDKDNVIYEQISNSYPFAVNVVFGADVTRLSTPNNRFAESGFIPIPAMPTSKSAVAISVEELAGNDGEFDRDRNESNLDYQIFDDETLQMATVIAHEIGHALGLKNSVEIQGERVIDSDVLSDTPSCVEENGCEVQRPANENIMFPYSIKKHGTDNEFWTRDKLTNQQAIIIKQNVLTRLK